MKADKKTEPRLLSIISLAAAGVILLLFGGGLFGNGKNDSKVSAEEISGYDEVEYEMALVKKIESVCSDVRGAGRVSVAVMLDGSYKAIYAQNSADGSSVRREYLIVGSGSSEKALLLGYSPPEILGVAIVCVGGADQGVRAEIISLVSSLLHIPTNKIYVAEAKK